jgi:hypothetical protein
MSAGWYDVTMVSNKTYYNSNYTYDYHTFSVETAPVLEFFGYGVDPTSGGWGEVFNFSVNVTDEDGDTVRVYAYERKYGDAEWGDPLYGPGGVDQYQDCQPCDNTTLTFTIDFFDCSNGLDNNLTRVREFKFNATDDPPGIDDTDEIGPRNYTLSRNDARLEHVQGNDTWIYRPGGSSTLELRIFDLVKNQYANIPNTRSEINVTNSTDSWISSGELWSDNSGYITYNFDPACSPKYDTGYQTWRGAIVCTQAAPCCYADNVSDNLTVKIWTDPLNYTLTIPDGEHFRRGVDNISIRGRVYDECVGDIGGVDSAAVTFEGISPACTFECSNGGGNDGGGVTDEFQSGGTRGWYNCTFWGADNTSGWSDNCLNVYNTTMYATKAYYNSSAQAVDNDSFILTQVPFIRWASPSLQINPAGGGWGATHTFRYYFEDDEGSSDSVNITLWKSVGVDNWTLINYTIRNNPNEQLFTFVHSFNCGEQGTNYYKINVTDQWNDTNETAVDNWDMGKDRVNTYAETGVPGDTVIRPGSSTTYMSVYFSDYDQDYVNVGAGVDGKIWVTTNGSGSNSWDDGHANQTESDGYLRYWFDPECSPLYLVGPQQWKGGIESDACYENLGGNSTPYGLTVEGNLNSSIESPQQGNVSTVGEMLYTRYNVTGDCGELVNETSTTVEYRSPAGGWESYSSNDEGDGWYNYDWDTSFHIGGWYDIRVNASKTYYTANSSTWDDWFYLTNTPPSITDANVTPSAGPWGDVYEYSVNIWDTQQDNVTCELWVSTDGGSNYYMKNSTIIWGGRDWCNLTVGDALDGTEFNCSDIGTDNLFHFRIDDETNVNYTNNISGPNLTANTAMITYRFGNNSNISRDDALSNYLAEYTVYVNDTDRVFSIRQRQLQHHQLLCRCSSLFQPEVFRPQVRGRQPGMEGRHNR